MIDFENVTKAYPNGTLALDNVTLHVDDGEFVFIVGHSGAGKTTLMKLLLREEKATAGRIVVGDYDLTKIGRFTVPYYRRELGVVFQDFRLFPKKTVFENVAFAMEAMAAHFGEDAEHWQAFLDESRYLSWLTDARKVALDVGHETWHSSLAKTLGNHLQ